MCKTEVPEYRHNRNFVRVGDTVKCSPKVGPSFKGIVRRILADEETGEVLEVEVTRDHKKNGGFCGFRTLTPEHISRVAQSRVEP